MIKEEYANFFKGLEANNNSEWFKTHKKDYEDNVKAPFLELLQSLIPEIQKLEPQISTNPKDALFRINRDIRFSKDKTPYNVLMKAGFSPGGKKSLLPGYYLGIGSEYIHIGGGLFNVNPPELKRIREYLKETPEEFKKVIHSQWFKESFGELKGERAKRLDKEIQAVAESIPEIANKQFYAMKKLNLREHIGIDLRTTILKYFKEIDILNRLLNEALK